MNYLATFFWDPNPIAFHLPILHAPVLWYSLFFACGFFLAYQVGAKLLYNTFSKDTDSAVIKKFIDALVLYLFVGMLVGARLGHVFFYEWSYYKAHLHKIFYTWEGGLASHGAAIGIIVSLALFWHRHKKKIKGLSFLQLLDILCIGIAVACGCVRIGNFFNQELIGTPTDVSWAVYFGHPFEGYATLPCHPVQLYEALFYLIVAAALYVLHKRKRLRRGTISGLFFLLVFTFRIAIEYIKLQGQDPLILGLYTAQVLSIPFILLGMGLLYRPKTLSKSTT